MTSTSRLRSLPVWVFVAVALTHVGCGTPDTSGRNEAIESVLDARYGTYSIETGRVVMTSQAQAKAFVKCQDAGLVTLLYKPSSYEFTGKLYEVSPTQGLLTAAIKPPEELRSGPRWFPTLLYTVKAQEAKIEKITLDQKYEGPLASPGEKYYLTLGVYTAHRTEAGAKIHGETKVQYRFRCVAKRSSFDGKWTVVALDTGDDQSWFTNTVK